MHLRRTRQRETWVFSHGGQSVKRPVTSQLAPDRKALIRETACTAVTSLFPAVCFLRHDSCPLGPESRMGSRANRKRSKHFGAIRRIFGENGDHFGAIAR